MMISSIMKVSMDKKVFLVILAVIVGLIIFFDYSMKKSTTSDNSGISVTEQITQPPASEPTPPMTINAEMKYNAIISTDKGDIEVELFASEAPITVNNFVYLSRKGFYNGIIFHRVIKNFMIQTGDPLGNGSGGPGYAFEDEISKGRAFDKSGMLAMANSGPNTNGSQFFITHTATPWLNGHHTIFGKVTKGMDVVNTIATTQTSENDKPAVDINISKITINEQ